MKKHWFQIIKEHACMPLREEAVDYEREILILEPHRLYFVVEGCVIVRSFVDRHILYIVRSRGCLNIEELIAEQYEYEYVRINQAKVIAISKSRMHLLVRQYPKLMQRLLRHEHHILDQMVQFAKLYRDGCQESDIKALYERLHPPFSYAVFQKQIRNDILVSGVDTR